MKFMAGQLGHTASASSLPKRFSTMSSSANSDFPPRKITEIVGRDHVRIASKADAIDGVSPRFIVEPATPSEVGRVLAVASTAGQRLVPRGGGTKLGWGNPPQAVDGVLSLRRLDRVLEHAAGDMTVTVEAGCTIAELQQSVAEHGQRLALDPLWPTGATVGGVLATADAGPLRWTFGSVRDLVLGVTVALSDGTLARSGGKVVKNVAGYDLPKLLVGSFGTLGVITQATFRLHPLPETVRTLQFSLPITEVIKPFVAAMHECLHYSAAVQICRHEESTTADVRVEGPTELTVSKVQWIRDAAIKSGAVELDDHGVLEPWTARERLFDETGTPRLVARFGLPPAKLVFLPDLLTHPTGDDRNGTCVAQADGTGLIRLDAGDVPELTAAARRLRESVESFGGSLVVLDGPPELKAQFDAWGDAGDALPLMRRIKEQFDPTGTLSAGRFVGGI